MKKLICSGAAMLMMTVATSAQASHCTPVFDITPGTTFAPTPPNGAGSPLIGAFYTTEVLTPGTRSLIVGGAFDTIGGVAGTSGVALWNGSSFQALGSGIRFINTAEISTICEFDGKLWIGGQIAGSLSGVDSPGVIRFDPATSTYESVNSMTPGSLCAVRSLVVYKGELYAAGTLPQLGSTFPNNIAKWDSTTNDWVSVPDWIGNATGFIVDMVVFNDGSGEKLYVCGNYTNVNSLVGPASRWVARFDGTTWEALGDGLTVSGTNYPRDIFVYDDGNGPALYAIGGLMNTVPSSGTSSSAMKWDGKRWSKIDGFRDDASVTAVTVNSSALYNDGTGTTIYSQARLFGNGAARQVMFRLENGRFEEIENNNFGLQTSSGAVHEMLQFADNNGTKLWLGGSFTEFNGGTANRLAYITGCTPAGSPNTCPADFNDSGDVTADDIFAYLDAWFAANGVPCP